MSLQNSEVPISFGKSAQILIAIFTLLDLSCQSDVTKEGIHKNIHISEISSEYSNIDFQNNVVQTEELNYFTWEYIYNGGGVGIADLNNDSLPDLVFTGNQVHSEIFLNQGNLRFKKSALLTEEALSRWSSGITFVDINLDGWMDIYLSNGGPNKRATDRANQLYLNEKGKGFIESAMKYGIADTGYSTQSVFFDFDLDGDLDLYVMNHPGEFYNSYTNIDLTHIQKEGRYSDHLYENKGGSFVDVTDIAGITNHGFGLGIAVGDLNNDGYPDLYVTNDYDEADFYYVNQQNGTFKNEILDRVKHISQFGMGVDIADINNDGYLDFMTLDMAYKDHVESKRNMASMSEEKFKALVAANQHYQYMSNALQLNNGLNTYSEIAQLAGVDKTSWSWGVLFGDFNHDAHVDVFISKGSEKNILDRDFQARVNLHDAKSKGNLLQILSQAPEIKTTNTFFQNNGDLTFSDLTTEAGIILASVSHGVAYGDLDLDGDLDIVTNNFNQTAQLYRNDQNDTNFLVIQLQGPANNPAGIGARVELFQESLKQIRENYPNKGYLSASESVLHFGLGNEPVTEIIVYWPDGKRNIVGQSALHGKRLHINYNKAKLLPVKKEKHEPYFVERTEDFPFKYKHIEDPFDDFQQELLLPQKNSQLGPPIAVADIDGDGLEDIFLGGAAKSSGYLLRQLESGAFENCSNAVLAPDAKFEDTGALFFDFDGDKDLDLYVVSGGNEVTVDKDFYQDRLYRNEGKGIFTKTEEILPFANISGESVATGDIDLDGDLDLFVGGRLVPGKYPSAPISRLLINENGVFKEDTLFGVQFSKMGMVTSSQFSDLDNNGYPDLVISGEWMPITIIYNQEGKLVNRQEISFSNGWWYTLQIADLDKDGDLDLVAGNLGRNHKYRASRLKPFNIYAGDLDGNNSWDLMLSQFQKDKNYPVRGRECSSQQMPFIKDKFKNYEQFAVATIEDIIPPTLLESKQHLETYTFTSSIFENDGKGTFQPIALPNAAQVFPVKSILYRDLNKDGLPDLILAGNIFETEIETIRHDAGFGLSLINMGNLHFEAKSAGQSGLYLPGNTRKMVHLNYTGLNIPLLICTVNNSYMQVFQIQ